MKSLKIIWSEAYSIQKFWLTSLGTQRQIEPWKKLYPSSLRRSRVKLRGVWLAIVLQLWTSPPRTHQPNPTSDKTTTQANVGLVEAEVMVPQTTDPRGCRNAQHGQPHALNVTSRDISPKGAINARTAGHGAIATAIQSSVRVGKTTETRLSRSRMRISLQTRINLLPSMVTNE